MSSLLFSISRKPDITLLDDNRIRISFTIPAELLEDFSKLFDALSGFIRIIEREKRLARCKALSEAHSQSQQAEQVKQRYYDRIVTAYDRLTGQGLSRTSAIKRISADLRKENHPWASVDLVRSSLIAAGRPGRIGRPRRQS